MLNRGQKTARPAGAAARLPVALYILLNGFLAAGLSGLVASSVPAPWGIRVWLGLTGALGAAMGLAHDRTG